MSLKKIVSLMYSTNNEFGRPSGSLSAEISSAIRWLSSNRSRSSGVRTYDRERVFGDARDLLRSH
jgi:hypothetical protein